MADSGQRPAVKADAKSVRRGASAALEQAAEFSIRKTLTQRSTILLALSVMGSWCLGNSIGSWLPSYYNEVFKIPLEKASSILSVVTVGGTAGLPRRRDPPRERRKTQAISDNLRGVHGPLPPCAPYSSTTP